jgi:hypothetical protein
VLGGDVCGDNCQLHAFNGIAFRNKRNLFDRIFTKFASIFQPKVKPECTEQLPLRELSPCHVEDELSIQTHVSSGKAPHGLDGNQIFSQRVFSQEVGQGCERLEWLSPEDRV